VIVGGASPANSLSQRDHERIDFSIETVRQPDPKGDCVNVVLSGKSLPRKQY
jgi:hypothetical protein